MEHIEAGRYHIKFDREGLSDTIVGEAAAVQTLMTLSDEELHSWCLARYHVAPEPLRDAGGI